MTKVIEVEGKTVPEEHFQLYVQGMQDPFRINAAEYNDINRKLLNGAMVVKIADFGNPKTLITVPTSKIILLINIRQ